MQEIEVKDTEVESISKFADTEGQVFRYKIASEPPIFPLLMIRISIFIGLSQISKNDFISYCRHSEMFANLDKNKDKVVSDIEVTSKAQLAFKALDKNHDGFISKKEFSKISKNLNSEQVLQIRGLYWPNKPNPSGFSPVLCL